MKRVSETINWWTKDMRSASGKRFKRLPHRRTADVTVRTAAGIPGSLGPRPRAQAPGSRPQRVSARGGDASSNLECAGRVPTCRDGDGALDDWLDPKRCRATLATALQICLPLRGLVSFTRSSSWGFASLHPRFYAGRPLRASLWREALTSFDKYVYSRLV